MSYSRLEKFIYAICSMDVSDLPVPLSRIEKLWNCLITGETPDFEPLSRNEKYLMAMLDRYDISNLPAPMSRGEKLLYKIAVGETDLSDVPGYLSQYEELLKYLIENGGISGGDFEYVLYTLNQSLYTLYTTAEKPVKSAILKGQTLVNLVTQKSGSFNGTRFLPITLSYTLKTNAKYFVKFNVRESSLTNGVTCRLKNNTGGVVGSLKTDGIITVTGEGYNYIEFLIRNADDVTNGLDAVVDDIMVIEYQEGMENWDISFFEGMQSVKMPVLTTTGKNLFNGNLTKGGATTSVGIPYEECFSSISNIRAYSELIKTNGNSIAISLSDSTKKYALYQYDDNKCYISGSVWSSNQTQVITLNSNTMFVNICVGNSDDSDIRDNLTDFKKLIQIEEGSIATSYEPYKTNILTTPEDLELRGIGDVKDTLDLMTGELTQRVSGLECINQNSKLSQSGTTNDTTLVITTSLKSTSTIGRRKLVASHELIKYAQLDYWYGSLSITFRLPKSNENFATLENFKQYLTQNPFYYYRELEQNEISIKTVDLTVVDQDNQPTQLGTFENVTHVSLVAENLIPEVEMKVVTRISEELASASPLMDDISTEQQQLETTVDEQSNNVDATMIATTEIYEETL